VNPTLLLVGAALFTWGMGEGMFLYFVPLYLQQLGAAPLVIGTVYGAFGFAMLLAHIPAGYLSDRLGRRPLIRVAWLMGLLAAVVMALGFSLEVFVAGFVLYGVTGFVSSPLFSYVTAARGNLTAGRAMTLVSAMYNLGAVIGPVSGGWVGERYELRTIFIISAIVFAVSSVLVLFLKPQPRDLHDEHHNARTLLANGRFLGYLAVVFFVTFAMYLPQPLTPNFLQNERGITVSQMGSIGSVGNLGNVVFNLVLGQLNSGIGFALGQVFVALFATLIWKGTGQPWYLLGYFLLGGYRAARLLAIAQVRVLIHPSQMGLAYGMSEAGTAMAWILAPLLAGFLYDKNPASIYPLSLVLITIGVIVSLSFAPREKRSIAKEVV
jgi:MFS family permease